MAKSKNHRPHNQSYKAHKKGTKKPKLHGQTSTAPPNGEGSRNITATTTSTTDDALEFLRKVRTTFEQTPDMYRKFLEIMKDFKNCKISSLEATDKVVNLFHGHDDLLLAFNVFLPEENKIILPVQQPVPTPVLPPVQSD